MGDIVKCVGTGYVDDLLSDQLQDQELTEARMNRTEMRYLRIAWTTNGTDVEMKR